MNNNSMEIQADITNANMITAALATSAQHLANCYSSIEQIKNSIYNNWNTEDINGGSDSESYKISLENNIKEMTKEDGIISVINDLVNVVNEIINDYQASQQ